MGITLHDKVHNDIQEYEKQSFYSELDINGKWLTLEYPYVRCLAEWMNNKILLDSHLSEYIFTSRTQKQIEQTPCLPSKSCLLCVH